VNVNEAIHDALAQFGGDLTLNFAARVEAQPEDQLKGPCQTLLRSVGAALGRKVTARAEARVADLGGRPDLGVDVDGLLTGHVELKAPGKGARAERLKGHDKEQWQKFQSLPNLLYTDGNEWSLYRSGELIGRAKASGDVTKKGRNAYDVDDAGELVSIFTAFLNWHPIVPTGPRALAHMLAPLCRVLREDVIAAMQQEGSALAILAADWRRFLFPDADDAQFADAYAQTVTYALLLARLEGAADVRTGPAAVALDARHGLLAQALRVLTDPQARAEIDLGLDLLERAIGAVDPAALRRRGSDPWLYFYEDFLAAYDPRLRNNRGVYYTPHEVIRAQVRLVSDLLVNRFGKDLSYADDVVFLDPAAGTGPYPLAAIQHGLDLVRDRFGPGAVANYATTMAGNVNAFEILVGPYAVAHLRLTQEILDNDGELPPDGVHVYLTDTLESPYAHPEEQQVLPLLYQPLSREHERARTVKRDTKVLVCMGNPPYDRQQIDPDDPMTERKGGWIRFGDGGPGQRTLLDDFLDPVKDAGLGVHAKNLYNDYVYFWRWALWKVFDSTDGPGIVSFITASSYLRGPGFAGVREVMRRTFDEMWIIDLEGDNLGARKTENVFAIQTPVAIAIGVRYGEPQPDTPAEVHYSRISGTRAEKLNRLDSIGKFADLSWQGALKGWVQPFLPRVAGNWYSWPNLTDLFPWQHSGAQFKRTWPIAESRDVLDSRWHALLAAPAAERTPLFRTTRDRSPERQYPALDGSPHREPSINSLSSGELPPEIVRYAYRSFDRQWAIADARVGDFLRPVLWQSLGPRQVFMTSLLTNVLGLGPAATVTALVPDLHHFRGSFGGADVIPLWRDAAATDPNVTAGVLDALASALGEPVSAEDLFAYCFSILASPEYVERFSEELTVPGPRIPITKDPACFRGAVALGRRLLWLHTYGSRFVPDGERPGRVPQGQARCTKPVPSDPDRYPESFTYTEATRTLHVGDGEFGPVSPEVWSFSVSGLQVVKSWLDYRKRSGAGRKSSPLDDIRPTQWPTEFTTELLELLWVLEATVEMFPELAANLDAIIESDLVAADDLPLPTDAERQPPDAGGPSGGELQLL
jgi:hypothetical protein